MIVTPELSKANAWCAMNNPAEVAHLQKDRPAFLSLSGMSGIAKPVVSGAAVTGSSKDEALANDKAVKDLLPSGDQPITIDRYNDLLKTFQNSPGTGCTTVMDMARIAAGFNPLSPDLEGNQQAFDDYVKRIMAAPFFFLNDSSRTDYHRGEQNWNTAVDSIVDLYD